MDEAIVREHLAEIRKALAGNEEEHEVLMNLLKGYEGWLRLHGETPSALQLGFSVNGEGKGKTAPKGKLSLRRAVIQVLQDARGMSLHASEMWRLVQALGVQTSSPNPVGVVDFTAHSLKRQGLVEKTAPRTWRWTSLEPRSEPGERNADTQS